MLENEVFLKFKSADSTFLLGLGRMTFHNSLIISLYKNGNPPTTVSVSGVTYCNINPESYLSNFRGQCYLFTLLFLCPLVRKEIPVGFDWSPVGHFSHPVEQVGEIFKEVDAMQPAGTGQ